MLTKHEITTLEAGTLRGPMSPMLFVREFLSRCRCPQALKIWRVDANVDYKDGKERGTADLLLALLTDGALVLMIDFGVGGMGVGVKWSGRETEVWNDWRKRDMFYDPPTDDELREIIDGVDVEAELAELRQHLKKNDNDGGKQQ